MPNRTIKSNAHASGQMLSYTLSSLFALELFAPSPAIYVVSPWISDFPLLDNAFGQFRALIPENEGRVRFSAVLNALQAQGTVIHVLTRPTSSQDFVFRLHPDIHRKVAPNLHEKSLLTAHFYLRGSLNLTYMGVNRNDEHVELSSDAGDIAQALVNVQLLWEATTA